MHIVFSPNRNTIFAPIPSDTIHFVIVDTLCFLQQTPLSNSQITSSPRMGKPTAYLDRRAPGMFQSPRLFLPEY